MNILIYSGSFDPPHLGHIDLLRRALKTVKPDLTLVIPSWHSVNKTAHASGPLHRYWMTYLTLHDLFPGVEVSSLEIDRKRQTYTYEILRLVKEMNPAAQLFLLMGQDSYKALPSYRNAAEIRRTCTLVVGKRGGELEELKSGGARDILLPGEGADLSSSVIRYHTNIGQDIDCKVTSVVQRYIETWGLYREQ